MSNTNRPLRRAWVPLLALGLVIADFGSYVWNQKTQFAAQINLVRLMTTGQKTIGVTADRQLAEALPEPARGVALAVLSKAKYGKPVSLSELKKMEAEGKASVKSYEEAHLQLEGPANASWGFSMGSAILLGLFAMTLAMREFRRSLREGAGQ